MLYHLGVSMRVSPAVILPLATIPRMVRAVARVAHGLQISPVMRAAISQWHTVVHQHSRHMLVVLLADLAQWVRG